MPLAQIFSLPPTNQFLDPIDVTAIDGPYPTHPLLGAVGSQSGSELGPGSLEHVFTYFYLAPCLTRVFSIALRSWRAFHIVPLLTSFDYWTRILIFSVQVMPIHRRLLLLDLARKILATQAQARVKSGP
jgi:hypothetical protein